jgi:hypothetical protein
MSFENESDVEAENEMVAQEGSDSDDSEDSEILEGHSHLHDGPLDNQRSNSIAKLAIPKYLRKEILSSITQFDGSPAMATSEIVREFCTRIRAGWRAAEIDENDEGLKEVFLGTKVIGEAFKWFERVRNEYEKPKTLEGWLKRLHDGFISGSDPLVVDAELESLRQTDKETIRQYGLRVDALVARGYSITMAAQLRHFVRGLRAQYRKHAIERLGAKNDRWIRWDQKRVEKILERFEATREAIRLFDRMEGKKERPPGEQVIAAKSLTRLQMMENNLCFRCRKPGHQRDLCQVPEADLEQVINCMRARIRVVAIDEERFIETDIAEITAPPVERKSSSSFNKPSTAQTLPLFSKNSMFFIGTKKMLRDTGADSCIMSPATATSLGLTQQTMDHPIQVEYANQERAYFRCRGGNWRLDQEYTVHVGGNRRPDHLRNAI